MGLPELKETRAVLGDAPPYLLGPHFKHEYIFVRATGDTRNGMGMETQCVTEAFGNSTTQEYRRSLLRYLLAEWRTYT